MLDFTWRARTESLRSLRRQQWYTSSTDCCILCTSGQLETMSLLFHTVDSIRTSKDVHDKRSFWHRVRSYWTPPTVRRGGGGVMHCWVTALGHEVQQKLKYVLCAQSVPNILFSTGSTTLTKTYSPPPWTSAIWFFMVLPVSSIGSF